MNNSSVQMVLANTTMTRNPQRIQHIATMLEMISLREIKTTDGETILVQLGCSPERVNDYLFVDDNWWRWGALSPSDQVQVMIGLLH